MENLRNEAPGIQPESDQVFTSVCFTWNELKVFLGAAFRELGDPSLATGFIVVPWGASLAPGEQFYFEWDSEARLLLLTMVDVQGPIRVPIEIAERPLMVMHELVAYQVRRIAPGVWALSPSLNIPTQLHAFVVMHGVPEPPPWESLITVVPA